MLPRHSHDGDVGPDAFEGELKFKAVDDDGFIQRVAPAHGEGTSVQSSFQARPPR